MAPCAWTRSDKCYIPQPLSVSPILGHCWQVLSMYETHNYLVPYSAISWIPRHASNTYILLYYFSWSPIWQSLCATLQGLHVTGFLLFVLRWVKYQYWLPLSQRFVTTDRLVYSKIIVAYNHTAWGHSFFIVDSSMHFHNHYYSINQSFSFHTVAAYWKGNSSLITPRPVRLEIVLICRTPTRLSANKHHRN